MLIRLFQVILLISPSIGIAMETPSNDNSIIYDFLHNHDKFKALWGTREKNETSYHRLPKEIAQRIVREALAPALAMLKKNLGLMTTTKKVSKTFFEEPMGYKSRMRWNCHAINDSQMHSLDNNECPEPFEGHPTTKLAFKISLDCSVRIWNTQTKNCVQRLIGHTKPVCHALFNPSGNLLATSSDDKTVKLWNIYSGECLHTLQKHWFKAPTIRFNKNGSRLVITDSNMVEFFDVATGKVVHSICGHGHTATFHNVAFDDEETHFIGLHLNETGHPSVSRWNIPNEMDRPSVSLWNAPQKKWIKQLDTHYCEELDPSDNVFLTKGSRKKLVDLWDIGGYFAAVKLLDNLSLEQALLLNCLAHTMLINKTLRKKHCYEKPEFLEKIMQEFDFNQFPHLQPYFKSLPKEIQHGLQEYVILRDDEDNSWCSIA